MRTSWKLVLLSSWLSLPLPIISIANRYGGIIMPVLRAPAEINETKPSGQVEIKRVLNIEVPVIVKLAERSLTLAEVMRLGIGAIIEFSRNSDEPLELMINNKPIGLGEVVKVGENFGLRIRQIGDVKDIIRSLGE